MRKVFFTFLLLVLAAGLLAGSVLWFIGPHVARLTARYLSTATGQPLKIESVGWSLWDGPHVTIDRLELGPLRPAEPPLLKVEEIRISLDLLRMIKLAWKGGSVEMEELPAIVSRVTARNTLIQQILEDPDSAPLEVTVESLILHSLSLDRATSFEAYLRHPETGGDLALFGRFGPWNRTQPLQTPYSGVFLLDGGRLDRFEGMDGRLAAAGIFRGTLADTRLQGELAIPDFSLRGNARPVPLSSDFIVQILAGGEVSLPAIECLIRGSRIMLRGAVRQGGPPDMARRFDFQVLSEDARLEDLLPMFVRGERPPLSGSLRLASRLRLPSGEQPVQDRLEVHGWFEISQGLILNISLLEAVGQATHLSRGSPTSGTSLATGLKGEFVFREGMIWFSDLQFSSSGLAFRLRGSYGLEKESIDLRGTVAFSRGVFDLAPDRLVDWLGRLSPGIRSRQVKIALPIAISGTRRSPRFAIIR